MLDELLIALTDFGYSDSPDDALIVDLCLEVVKDTDAYRQYAEAEFERVREVLLKEHPPDGSA